ncbi:penicillin-binding protein 2 [Candidatus Berkelbacteria bacterium]|nr:penicillin-binding protein 2 [Candidatus Berkelbacteria bacterium]
MSLFAPDESLGSLSEPDSELTWVIAEDAPRLAAGQDRHEVRWHIGLAAILAVLLMSRLLYLQVAHGGSNQLLAAGNRIRNQSIEPPRGVILDRHGTVLASNVAAFGLELVPAYLPKERSDREAIYTLTGSLVNQTADAVRDEVIKQGLRSLDPILLLDRLSHEDALLLKIKIGDAPGLRVVNRPLRHYEIAPGLAHVLGYTGKIGPEELTQSHTYSLESRTGKAGFEQSYEAQLQGQPGVEQVEVDSTGYLKRVLGLREPIPGDTLVTTIDLPLQRKLGEVLQAKLDEVGSPAGVGIVMDPRDGGVLALVSLPDYDDNEFATELSPDRYQAMQADPRAVLTNRAIAGQYPSGSAIKPVIAAGGLADGVITESTTIDAPAEIRIGDFVFPDWKRHGVVDVKRALAVSSNVFFYAVGGGWDRIRGLGINRLNHYLELFGFGKPTGIDLGGEASGLVPTPAWKQQIKDEAWYLGDTYHAAIGQGDFLVTPLQLANATAIIASAGTVQMPHLLWKDQPVATHAGIGPPSTAKPIGLDPNVLRVVQAGMRQAVTDGSARRLQSVPVPVAGKTGTAQFGSEEKTHAWFTGYAPADHPELVITILIDGGGHGDQVAVPVAEEVLKSYYARPAEDRK